VSVSIALICISGQGIAGSAFEQFAAQYFDAKYDDCDCDEDKDDKDSDCKDDKDDKDSKDDKDDKDSDCKDDKGDKDDKDKDGDDKESKCDDDKGSDDDDQRRALPAPFASPPFPSAEYQGFPLIGVPPDDTIYPLQKSLQGSVLGAALECARIRTYGWFNGSVNLSNCRNSNTPDAYWIVPNSAQLDQFVFRVERQVDSVQTDYIDIGFRSSFLYGMDYRYLTSGGWTSDQLLVHNRLYGFDFTEQYIDIYYPWLAEGMILKIGRWVAFPDIEGQLSPDNYMGSHSLLFTFDTATQTGVLATVMLNEYWTVQAGVHAGTDMAPWYVGAVPTGLLAVRWVSCDNNDSIYLVWNSINAAKFRRFTVLGQPAGHDNFNYIVGTWQHKFSDQVHTKTESYVMWQRDAVVGGTPSIGPVEPYGGGGGIGPNIPGTTYTYGVVNFTVFRPCDSDSDFITFRNEIWRDTDGERSGYAGTYTSNAVGWTHHFNSLIMIRPEIGYYRNWNRDAFDLGTRRDLVLAGIDLTVRY
jgi:hypothetical protein